MMKFPKIIIKPEHRTALSLFLSLDLPPESVVGCKVTRGAVLWSKKKRTHTILHSNYLGSFGTPVFPPQLCQPAELISLAISVSFYC